MSSRDIFLNILDFRKCDRTLKWELGYWGATILRWQAEGLPKKSDFQRGLIKGEFVNGPGMHSPMPSYGDTDDKLINLSDKDIAAYFNFDKGTSPFKFNWFYCPFFEEKIVNEAEEKVEYIDNLGIRSLRYKDDRSMPQWLEHPIKTESDWEEIKRDRLSLTNFNKRYTVSDIEGYISESKKRDYPLLLFGDPVGFFGILRFMIGEENLYYWYYDKPVFLKNILDHLCNLWLNIAEELTSKIDFDYGYFFEDMAYKGGSLISPAIFKEFIAPYYKKLIDFAKTKRLRHFILDSDGYMEDMIPLFQEAGITGILPWEIRAGNDLERIRHNYPQLGIFGGIDKTALTNKQLIDKELEKVKIMIKKGGYVPYVDHAVPPDVCWNNFKYYREKLNLIIDSTRIISSKIGS